MTRSDAATLLPLAESIADGSAIDWDSVEASAGAADQAVIRQLRILSNLAGLHRSLPADPSEAGVSVARHAASAPAVGSWAHLSLIARLGGGTFGDVYRAWDRHLEREVALKLLKVEEAGDLATSRIAAEGRLLARVHHPNVITVHGVAVHDQRVGLWMELVRGVTLEQQLSAQGPFSAREAALLGIDLCHALAAIHAAGLIHRDVKAQNVMRADGGRIVLMDLGTGREADQGGREIPDLAGTPLYIAPEIFAGASASDRTDLYSLGVLLYHLVTGSFPVRATTIDELRDGHAQGRIVRLRDARADLPTAFVRVIERAIAPEPERRYASAGAFEAGLIEALDQAAPAPPEIDAAKKHAPLFTWRLAGLAAAALAVALSAAVIGWPSLPGRPATSVVPGSIRSIAVLPLANLSGDPSQEYLADGMTDELIGTLGRLSGLNVISRTSVMQFKGSGKPLPEIARALRVDAVLEGSVLAVPSDPQDPNGPRRLRINARLIYAGTDTQLWDRRFERAAADALGLQSEVANAVAEGIDLRLNSQQQGILSGPQTAASTGAPQFDLFDLYLKGRYYLNMRTEDGFKQSIQYFQEIIDRNPGYALAHAGLADAYNLLVQYGYLDRAEGLTRASQAASKALDLDDSLAEAHTSSASVHEQRFEWAAAETQYRRAVETKPGYVTAHHWFAAYLAQRGRFAEALAQIQQAQVLDPLSIGVNAEHGAILLLARRYDEAIAQLQKAANMNPAFVPPHTILIDAYAHKRDYDRAIAEAARATALGAKGPDVRAHLGYVFAVAGRQAEAEAIATELAERYRNDEDEAAGGAASIYAALGQNDRAFEWLLRARQRNEYWIGYLAVDPKFDRLHDDPRFAKLLAEVGLAR